MSVAPPEAQKSLRCASFHSVKGGVGKSTLSYLVARRLAEEGPVALIDADLTGTSLADVLSLRAPQWQGEHERLPLRREPDTWRAVDPKRTTLGERASYDESHARVVPLLNDFLLWAKDRYDPQADVHPRALFWKLPEEDPLAERLFIVPSSALPNDLSQILPLIYDELHAAYLESRLEWLLHGLLRNTDVRTVVFDTPPTVPGLSRAILSMAMRLPGYVPLAEDGGTPLALTEAETCPITWAPFLVVTSDLQDLRAADRWLEGRDDAEVARIHVVLNKAEKEWDDLQDDLRHRLADVSLSDTGEDVPGAPALYDRPLLRAPIVVPGRQDLRIFRGDPFDLRAIEAIASLVERVGR